MFYTIHDTDVLLCCCCSFVSCIWLCDPMDCSTPGFPVLHCLQEFAQIHIHWIIQYIAQIYYCHLILRTHSSFTDYLNNVFLLKRFNSEACSDWASQVALVVKNLLASAQDIRDAALIPGSGRSPGEGHGNLLQRSCLENSMDRGAWWATIHGVIKSWTWLKQLSMHAHTCSDYVCLVSFTRIHFLSLPLLSWPWHVGKFRPVYRMSLKLGLSWW